MPPEIVSYSPDQERDDHGRFGEGHGDSGEKMSHEEAVKHFGAESRAAFHAAYNAKLAAGDHWGANDMLREDQAKSVKAFKAIDAPTVNADRGSPLLRQAQGFSPREVKQLPEGRWLHRDESLVREIPETAAHHLTRPDADARATQERAEKFTASRQELRRVADTNAGAHELPEGTKDLGGGLKLLPEGHDARDLNRDLVRTGSASRAHKLASHEDSLENLYTSTTSPEKRYVLRAPDPERPDKGQAVGRKINEHWTVLYDPGAAHEGFRLEETPKVEARDRQLRQRHKIPEAKVSPLTRSKPVLYPEIMARFYGQPLALLPEKIEAVAAFLRTRARGESVPPEEVAAVVAARNRTAAVRGSVAIVPIMGVICQRVGLLEQASGGIGTDDIGQALDEAVSDPGCSVIVLAFDSPGGSVFGIDELAAKIRAARDRKRVVGLADSMAASAAYWLYAQCSECWVTPGGQVGSVGVYTAHEDHSKAAEMDGVRTTLVGAGRYKTEASPYGPLDDDARAEMQSKVDHYYGMFVRALAAGRGCTQTKVRDGFGQGRMMTAGQALAAGMCDRVGTLADLLDALRPQGSGATAAARARIARVAEAEVMG